MWFNSVRRARAFQPGTMVRLAGWPALAAVAALVALAAPATAQDAVIGGIVESERSAQPVAGAQVQIVGTDRGALTDQRGRFMILGVSGTEVTLRVSVLGYRTAEVRARVGDQNVVVRLTETAIELDRLVVTGTAGAVQKRAIGNVVTQVQAAEVLDVMPVGSIQNLLNARAPGVVITPGTGMVGSGSQIRIRGSSSLSLSNQPLVYVDGVRVDNAQNTGPFVQAFSSSVISRINDFNPDDIESIEIIKGAAAATLYGTEASNGVIQIITKRGTVGAPQWNFTMRQGLNSFLNAENRMYTNFWRNPTTDQIESINLITSERERGTPIYRTGHTQNYSLSLGGGSQEVRYYLAGDMDREQGAERDNELRRMSGRANITVVPSRTMEVAANLGYVMGRFNLSCEAGCGGTTWGAMFSTPAHNLEGDRRRGHRSFTHEAYYGIWDRFQNLSRFTGSVNMNHRPLGWFTHRLTFGVDDTREDNQTIAERTSLYQEWNPTGTGGKDVGRREVTYNTFDYSGTVSLPVTPTVASNTSFGAQFYRTFTRFVSASGSDFALPGLRVISAAADRLGGETFVEEANVGIFGQQQFSLQDRLFLTLGLRADDHSAFGEEFSLVYYPKASATWVVSEEDFWTVPTVSTLRLRTAYGQTGLQPGAFDALRTFQAFPGPNDVSTISPATVGNPELGPERSTEFEFGFDAGLLDERLGVEFTWYNATTRDAILLEPVAPSTGFPGSRFVNIGELSNQGLEVALRATPIVTRTANWDARFSLARNTSEVINVGEDNDVIIVSADFGVQHRVGHPVGGWFHRKVVDAEFTETGAVIRASMLCDNGSGGTTACYDGTTPVAPFVFLGTSEPKYEGAFSSMVTLHNRVRLYGLVDFKTGFRKWDHVTRVRCALNNICHENVAPLEYLDTPESRARVASYQTGAVFGAQYINDASFAKLREVSVSYLLPDPIAQRFGATRANVSLAGRNLATWTNWTGMEPEARFLGGARGGFGGLEQNHLPQLTSFVATINVTF